MQQGIERILLTEQEIRGKVCQLGEQISRDYGDKELMVVGILKGAIIFLSDLVRQIRIPLTLDFVAVSSYGNSSRTSGAVRILKDLERSVEGKNVLIVEDIVDTGLTLKYLRENLEARGPAEVKICAFLDKPERRLVEVQVDYRGFAIPDHFVVGYGLDYAERFRQLPYVAILKPEVYRDQAEVEQ